MIRNARFVVIWLLAFLLPLQGLAAGVRMTCVAQHTVMMEVAIQVTTVNMAVHQHHEGMSSYEMVASQDSGKDVSQSEHTKHNKSSSCNSCGSCCIAAFAPSAPLNLSLIDVKTSVEIVSPTPLVTGFIPDGLERPPRQISA